MSNRQQDGSDYIAISMSINGFCKKFAYLYNIWYNIFVEYLLVCTIIKQGVLLMNTRLSRIISTFLLVIAVLTISFFAGASFSKVENPRIFFWGGIIALVVAILIWLLGMFSHRPNGRKG